MPTENSQRGPAHQRYLRLLALTLLLATGYAELAYRQSWLALADNAVYDLWHRIAGVRQIPQHVALAVIDDTALATHPDDPLVFWTPHVAKAAQALHQAGATAVGLDFLFAISPEAWLSKMNLIPSDISREFDVPFRAAINNGHLLLVGARLRDKISQLDHFLLPDRDYLLAIPDFDFANHIGLADLDNDIDGTVRSFVVAPALRLEPALAGQNLPRLGFAPLLALHSQKQSAHAGRWQLAGQAIDANATRRNISFAGPPGTVPRISLARLLAPAAQSDPPVKALRGKVVIIGGEFIGTQDLHFTPYSAGFSGASGRLMSGPELQANIVENLLSGTIQRPASSWQRLLYFGLLISAAV